MSTASTSAPSRSRSNSLRVPSLATFSHASCATRGRRTAAPSSAARRAAPRPCSPRAARRARHHPPTRPRGRAPSSAVAIRAERPARRRARRVARKASRAAMSARAGDLARSTAGGGLSRAARWTSRREGAPRVTTSATPHNVKQQDKDRGRSARRAATAVASLDGRRGHHGGWHCRQTGSATELEHHCALGCATGCRRLRLCARSRVEGSRHIRGHHGVCVGTRP